MKFNIALFMLFSIGFAACVRPPDYPIEPRLEFVGLSKSTVLQDGLVGPRDTFFLTVSFTDGDGDIGFQDSDSTLYVVDTRKKGSRIRVNDVQGLPSVPQQGAGNGITGEIRMRIFGGCCTNSLIPCSAPFTFPRDTVIYEVYIKDRAGNESNRIAIPPVYILCQ
jgi:hypothetical protein